MRTEPIDCGNEWRHQHGSLSAVDVRIDERGDRAIGVREEHECLLDYMAQMGWLMMSYENQREPMQRRLDAGLWLRECFHKAGLSPSGSVNYEQKSAENAMGAQLSSSMSEAEAWNRACFRDTMRDLPEFARILSRVCCHDEMPRRGEFKLLRDGLDRLADLRGL
jgi:hypothetical protein